MSRGTCRAEKKFLNYALFAGFFPQLVQGPINRYAELSKTLYSEKEFHYEQVTFGLQRILWGLFKKLVISERMAVIVNTIYGDYVTYSGLYIAVGTVCFAFQLYTDFSGAMDIALGLSEALGIGWPRILRHRFSPARFLNMEKMAYHAGNLDEGLYILPRS